MSLGKRAYNLLRGYVSTEWERMRGIEMDLAEKELRNTSRIPDAPLATPDSYSPAVPQDERAYARRLLGVSEDCSFGDLRKAFARLNKRSDPANFPANSAESQKAADIQRKVNWAYGVLADGMDETEKRFRTLELD